MIDDRTTNLNLPLPHPANDLEDDVGRLRSALSAVDGKLHLIDLLLASDDLTLDTVQELVTAIKSAQADILALDTVDGGTF